MTPGKIGECVPVAGHDYPVTRAGSRSDQQVMSAAAPALAANGDQKIGVFDRHVAVVGNDRERLDDLIDVGLARLLPFGRGELDPHAPE